MVGEFNSAEDSDTPQDPAPGKCWSNADPIACPLHNALALTLAHVFLPGIVSFLD